MRLTTDSQRYHYIISLADIRDMGRPTVGKRSMAYNILDEESPAFKQIWMSPIKEKN